MKGYFRTLISMNFEFEFIKDNVRIPKKARNAVSCRQYAEIIEKGGRQYMVSGKYKDMIV